MSDVESDNPGRPAAADSISAKKQPTPGRPWFNVWSRLAFANSATRREAKLMLFEESAVATQQGMPLDKALESCMRTAQQLSSNDTSSEPGSHWFYPKGLAGFFFIALWLGAFGILLLTFTGRESGGLLFAWLGVFFSYLAVLFTTSMLPEVERVARVLALRLLPLVRAGHSLGDAMEMLPRDYTREEVSIVRAGEGWGNLPRALQNLGRFQLYERKMLRHWARMSYPVWLLLFMMMIGLFVAVFIIPKFKDIYDQLGTELPRASQILLAITDAIIGLGIWVPFILIWLALIGFTVRQFMVGNRLVRDIAAVILAAITTGTAVLVAFKINDNFNFGLSTITLILVVIVAALIGIIAAMALLFQLEKSVLDVERLCNRGFGNLPFIGAPRRTEMESRWLATLSLALDSGIDAPAAVEAAGDTVGRYNAEASRKAAGLVRQGHSIGQAVSETGVLRDIYANRLRLLDNRPEYLQGLTDIADDAARDSFQTLNRASRFFEVVSVCLIGVGVGLFAYAMYMPLFNIPLIVGHW